MPDQESLQPFLEEFKVQFPEANIFAILPMLLTIDMATWKLPDFCHQGPFAPIAEFIEQNKTLREMFLK